jgi:ABC-type branched-subunit amino acid transport system substrate-binding protein
LRLTASKDVSNALVANWQKLSGQPAKLVLLDANTTDPTPEVSSALATNPDAMIVGVVGTLGQTVVEKLAARGVKIPLYGGIASSARVCSSSLASVAASRDARFSNTL